MTSFDFGTTKQQLRVIHADQDLFRDLSYSKRDDSVFMGSFRSLNVL